MSERYKNIVLDDHLSEGKERRAAFAKEAMRDNTPFPKTLTYEDIDKEFKRWVEEDLDISFEGSRIPTMVLYSNQRFSEYKQNWEFVDNNRNLILNFKTISRDYNPKIGEIVGSSRNIPGERRYTIAKELCQDENGRDFLKFYKMKQPFTIDLTYKIGIITNKFELINKFNMILNEKFKSIDCYIRPNGHFIPMKLNDVTDESELSLDDREFYSQSYSITVMAYIITEDSYAVEEQPILKLMGIDTELNNEGKCSVEIEDFDDGTSSIFSKFKKGGQTKTRFTIDCNLEVTDITISNISSFSITINDKQLELFFNEGNVSTNITYDNFGFVDNEEFKPFKLSEGDQIKIKNVVMVSDSKIGSVIIHGNLQ